MALTRGDRRLFRWAIVGLSVLGVVGLASVLWPSRSAGLARWMGFTPSRTAAASASYDEGDWKRAAELAREALKAEPNDMEALRIYARALARLGRDESAWAIYNNRLGLGRFLPEDYFLAGSILARDDELDKALSVWKKGATIPPDHPELLDALSRLAIRSKRLDEANEAARRLAKFPGWEAPPGSCKARSAH